MSPDDLQLGDIFEEDTFPETYEVIATDAQRGHIVGIIGRNTETGEETFFGGLGAYAPCLWRL